MASSTKYKCPLNSEVTVLLLILSLNKLHTTLKQHLMWTKINSHKTVESDKVSFILMISTFTRFANNV